MNSTNCGVSWERRRANSGFGWRQTGNPGRWWAWHIGGRGEEDAKQLWASLPGVYRQCAVCYSDFWEAYNQVVPTCRHRAVGKETGEISHVERTNGTFRQRVSRLVRKTLSFSKSKENHRRAIKYFIWQFNLAT